MTKLRRILTAAATAVLVAGPALAQDPTFFRIGTGSAGGTYFPIGGTIANGISAPPGSRPCEEGGQCGVPGLIAIAQSTTASVFNNTAVQNGELEAGLAAADVTRSMYLGVEKFEGKPHDKLRIVANLFPEDLHLVLPEGQSISGLADLEGKRVGIAGMVPKRVTVSAPAALARRTACLRASPSAMATVSVAEKASPAPVVSTTSTGKAGTCTSRPTVKSKAPRAPRFKTTA